MCERITHILAYLTFLVSQYKKCQMLDMVSSKNIIHKTIAFAKERPHGSIVLRYIQLSACFIKIHAAQYFFHKRKSEHGYAV